MAKNIAAEGNVPTHFLAKALRSRIIEYLGGTLIADLAKALGEKRRSLVRPRRK
ncbi:MAG TPA: hypothetical protein VGR40_03410 [Candidatus Binatus sp.]|nr:hypothetical protein [Candidatus Binatus sp.]